MNFTISTAKDVYKRQACTCAFVAFGLNFSCFVNTLFNFGRRLRLFFISKLVKFNCRYLYMYIKTVKQRTSDFIKVIMYLLRSTGCLLYTSCFDGIVPFGKVSISSLIFLRQCSIAVWTESIGENDFRL